MSTLIDWIKWLIGLAQPDNLRELVNLSGPWWVSYLILFAIIFSETGLLVGFFLPGDSLLFAAGLLASQEVFDVALLIALLSVAAVAGDAANYYLGLQMSEHVFERGRLRFVKHSHLIAAKEFYERHGGKAIILARFVPLVRTFTPFVAGVGRMGYARFAVYNVAGRNRLGRVDDVVRILVGPDSVDSRPFRTRRDRNRAGQRCADRRHHGAALAVGTKKPGAGRIARGNSRRRRDARRREPLTCSGHSRALLSAATILLAARQLAAGNRAPVEVSCNPCPPPREDAPPP